jgi:aspartate/methionine/tyrosine aminotransferase
VPSAADGNYFDIEYIKAPVILDCTYVSSTNKQKINVPKNTEQVFFSFSKGFGLVGERLGLVYTKEPHASLHLLKQFENWNYTGVRTMQLIMKHFAVDEMWRRHRDKQLQICKDYDITASDCFYVATSRDKFWTRRRRMSWNDTARICITSLFDNYL